MANEPPQLLGFLKDRIPSWLDSLAAISTQTAHRRPGKVPCPLYTERSRHELEVIHTQDGDLQKIDATSPTYGHIGPSNIQRKEETSSNRSIDSTFTRNNYRTQNSIVVFYDSVSQKRLESIVEDILKARGTIRKARALENRRMRQGPNNAAQTDEEDLDDDTVMAQVRLRRTRMKSEVDSPGPSPGPGQLAYFEKLGKRLEEVQDLCIRAAFELLRDGDCCVEVDAAVERLGKVLEVCEEEVHSSLVIQSPERRGRSSGEKKPEAYIYPDSPKVDASDESGESEGLSLSKIRLTSRMRGRA